MRRNILLSLLLSLALLLALAAPALAAEAPWYAEAQAYVTAQGLMPSDGDFAPDASADGADLLGALYILEGRPTARTGDGFAVWRETLPAAVRDLRTDNSLLVDAGDTVQDNYASLFLDEEVHPMVAAMNAIGYDVWVTGNHEYNYGLENLKKIIGNVEAKVLVGNVLDTEGHPLADGYTIIEKNGLRIGVIGMVTPNIAHWDAVNLAGCTVSDPVEATRRIIDEIEDETDLLIGVMHMGVNNELGTPHSGASDLAAACPELALIVAAHDHTSIEGTEFNGVLTVRHLCAIQSRAEHDQHRPGPGRCPFHGGDAVPDLHSEDLAAAGGRPAIASAGITAQKNAHR